MLKANRTYSVLLLIFTFSFFYRIILMLWNYFPPGADIGLHNSVIYSITGHGNTNFMYNFYQMGGGSSLTFPGYHIFASSIMMMTGLPEYFAQAMIVALFSSLLVLCSFLVTRKVWTEPAAYVVAFLVAISRFDIEMTLWGGYPNVITLLLIPLTFYLFLQKDRFSKTPFLVSTSILTGSIFLTHSLSAAIFVGVTVLTVLFVLVSPKTFGATRKTGFYWLLPIVLGVILVSPFLASAVPTYLHDNSSAPGVSGVNDINSAILSTRILPLEWVYPLLLIIIGFAVLSKRYNNHFFSLPTLLLCVWLFVPLFLTQSYLFKFIIDYNRFLYFVILPVIIFTAVLIDYGSKFFAEAIGTIRVLNRQIQKAEKIETKKILGNSSEIKTGITRSLEIRMEKTEKSIRRKAAWLSAHSTSKATYAAFILFFLLFSFVAIPVFLTPMEGQRIQSFYQVMNNQGWEALQWAKQNTSSNSVFVSDALYGWWLSGFAQRPTLSAVDPQYLTSARELAPAKNASYLLDTDYLIDNGWFQVREDGGYLSRHNPEFLAKIRNQYFPYSFFNFDSDGISVTLRNGSYVEVVNLSSLPVTEMSTVSTSNSESIIVTHGNGLFNFTQTITVYSALNATAISTKMVQYFAIMTDSLQTDNPAVTFDTLQFDLDTKGTIQPVISDDHSYVGLIDTGMKTIGQIIFSSPQSRPDIVSFPDNGYTPVDMTYILNSKTDTEFSYSIGVYQYSDSQLASIKQGTLTYDQLVKENTQTYLAELSQTPPPINEKDFVVFNYQKAMTTWNVSYISCRVPEMYPKFLLDPAFSLVFINSEVAIFQVKG
jgi:hypothetical protein